MHFVLAFLAGIIVKIVDWLEDDKKSRHKSKYFMAAIYGCLIGYLIANASFGILFLAALFAQVLSRKIDSFAHRLGFLTAFIVILFYQLPDINILIFGYFVVLAFLDEIDYVGILRPFNEYRPFLKLGPIPFVFLGRPDYLIGILAFDLGYELFKTLQNNKK
ncbi:hypothetical protein JXA56_01915 [Candidatus Micrarchaeota archaeon]|nr:hypothetical protein [Candidatus Micrarchaeota archaeon]